MGFREGEGLGKFGQGRKEIVEASTQRGRRGLGLTLQGFQGELNVDWRDEPEVKINYKCLTLQLCFVKSVNFTFKSNISLFSTQIWIRKDYL